jgi:hypothetical protein
LGVKSVRLVEKLTNPKADEIALSDEGETHTLEVAHLIHLFSQHSKRPQSVLL